MLYQISIRRTCEWFIRIIRKKINCLFEMSCWSWFGKMIAIKVNDQKTSSRIFFSFKCHVLLNAFSRVEKKLTKKCVTILGFLYRLILAPISGCVMMMVWCLFCYYLEQRFNCLSVKIESDFQMGEVKLLKRRQHTLFVRNHNWLWT